MARTTKTKAVVVTAEQIDFSGDLPVVQRTQYLRVREFNNQKVLTFRDIAEAYQVPENNVRQAFSRNADKWVEGCDQMSQPETMNQTINTAGGPQEIRLFSLRGAMRFAFHIKSGLADTIQNHLLDLWAKEQASQQPAIVGVPAWADQLAQATLQLTATTQQTMGRLQQIEERVEAMPDRITAQVKQSIQALDNRKRRLKELVGLIVQRAKILKDVQPQHAKLMIWSNVYNMAHANASPPASSLAAYVTKAQINTAIQALEMQLTLMGGVVPADQQELFEEAA